MDRPMPLALSRINIAQSIAIDTKMVVINIPENITVTPVILGTNNKTGKPIPIKKDVFKANDNPKNNEDQMADLLTGWLTSNSINSALLYIYILPKIIDTNGTVSKMTLRRDIIPLDVLSSRLNILHENTHNMIV